MSWIKNIRIFLLALGLSFPMVLHASFIESTIGTAVVNDATATFYNPGALTVLKNPQIVTLGSVASFHTHFSGQFLSSPGTTLSGASSTQSHYYLPSLYLAMPTTDKISVGLAVVSNMFSRGIDDNSVIRYVESSNKIQDIDFIPAVGIKLNDSVSVGAGLNFSYAEFLLEPISGVPGLNISDNQSRNESKGKGIGGDLGLLFKASKSTQIGFNYRSAISYTLSGKSILESQPILISNDYHFNFWTPARSVLSINQFLTENLGLIGTVQYIQWNVFKEMHIHGIATQIGERSVILPEVTVPHYLRNSWLLTLGSHYRITPKWVVRMAGTYNQSPANPSYQISNGDSIIVGGSSGYEIYKNINVDVSYAHAFIKNQPVHIANNRYQINGVNSGYRDSVSLKLTFDL